MKKTLLLVMMAAALTATAPSYARTLDAQAALKRAGEALAGEGPARVRAFAPSLQPTLTVEADGEPAVYLFSNNGAYLVVAGDDCAPAVLGYGTATDGTMAPAMRYWLDEYARQIEYARANSAAAVPAKATAADSKASIAPLVQTRWNQSAPYNNDCPTVGSNRCVTGCVATALAQVMKYHNYPATGTGTVSYTWNGQTLSFDYATDFDWTNMLDVYSSTATATQNAAVAKLMYACGVGVNMSYGTGESSATSFAVPRAMIDNFGYDKGVRFMPRDYYSLDEWQDIVYNNLRDYGPMQYSGQSSDGGHSFVCDGYDRDGYFHINWGWGGMSDGYFLLTALTPASQGIGGSSSGYNYGQDIIACVSQPREGSTLYEQILCSGNLTVNVNQTTLGGVIVLSGGGVQNTGFFNYSAGEIPSGQLGIKITAADGTVTYVGGATFKNLKQNAGYKSYSMILPSDLASGTYIITPCFKTSTGEWRDIRVPISTTPSLTMVVDGQNVTVNPTPSASVTVTGYTLDTPFYIGKDFKVTATLLNTTDDEFYGTVALGVVDDNGNLVGLGVDYPVDIMGGDEQTIEYVSAFTKWSGTPTAGTYYVCFVNTSNNYTQLSSMKEINLQAAPAQTVLGATAPVVENATAVNSTELKVSTTVSCTSGYFANAVRLVIFPYVPGSSVTSLASYSSDAMFLNAGESKDVNFNVNFNAAEKGKRYFCAVYTGQTLLAQQSGYFTVASTTGVDDVTVEEAPVATRYYNLQGIEVDADSLTTGVYVRVRTYDNGSTVTDRYLKH